MIEVVARDGIRSVSRWLAGISQKVGVDNVLTADRMAISNVYRKVKLPAGCQVFVVVANLASRYIEGYDKRKRRSRREN